MSSQPHHPRRSLPFASLTFLLSVLLTAFAPAPVAALACGEPITTSTALDADLHCESGDAVVVAAHGITLDLKGHTISGPGAYAPGTGAGVRVAGYGGVTVQNGTIEGFAAAVVLDSNATGSHLWNLVVRANDIGLLLANSSGNLVEKSFVQDNGRDGIKLGGFGSTNNDVHQNVVTGNTWGITAANGANGNRVTANTITGSEQAGIVVFDQADGNALAKNVVSGSVLDGIVVQGTCDGSAVTQNASSGNGRDGIRVDAGTSGTVVGRNVANLNGDDGIDVDSAGTTILKNAADANGGLGIEAVAGVVDGGGNSASENGDPAQCTGVSCE
jgi:parallel beta-helix repeat protein